jgi:hypothetical protein
MDLLKATMIDTLRAGLQQEHTSAHVAAPKRAGRKGVCVLNGRNKKPYTSISFLFCLSLGSELKSDKNNYIRAKKYAF